MKSNTHEGTISKIKQEITTTKTKSGHPPFVLFFLCHYGAKAACIAVLIAFFWFILTAVIKMNAIQDYTVKACQQIKMTHTCVYDCS